MLCSELVDADLIIYVGPKSPEAGSFEAAGSGTEDLLQFFMLCYSWNWNEMRCQVPLLQQGE